MSTQVLNNLDFTNVARILNLPIANASGQPVVFEQLQSAIEGLGWKDNVRVKSQTNVNLAAPGAAIDGVTLSVGDRFFAGAQTATTEQGIYVFNGAAAAATRSADMNVSSEFNNAVVIVDEGTNAGVGYRFTAINPTLGTTPILYTTFASGAGQATESLAGIARIATQAETDTGTDDAKFVTPLKLAQSVHAIRRFAANFGDGTANTFVINHNFSSLDVVAQVFEVSTGKQVVLDVTRTNANSLTLATVTIPTTNQYTVSVKR